MSAAFRDVVQSGLMKSPFPGMDPYLEQRWGDFHTRFVTYTSDALQPSLPQGLRARMEERVYIQSLADESRFYVPDVHVYERPGRRHAGMAVATEAAPLATPIIAKLSLEVTERFIEVIDVRSGGKVVSVIELLSPANTVSGRGRDEYLTKQRQYLDGRVNLVEIDLLRVGRPTTLASGEVASDKSGTFYHASVWRSSNPSQVEYYEMPLRQPLPRLPIPLRPNDPDVTLDLQAVLDTAYDRGRYDDIDYSTPVDPPLDASDGQWASALLEAAGFRPR